MIEFFAAWFGAGLLALCFMALADQRLGCVSTGGHYLRGRGWETIVVVITGGLFSFLFSLLALTEFITTLVIKETYEYKVVMAENLLSEDELNQLGEEEWKLQAILPTNDKREFRHFFVRSIYLR